MWGRNNVGTLRLTRSLLNCFKKLVLFERKSLMASIVDLKIRQFGADDGAWRLFPGVNYRHFETMKEYGRVFLEYSDIPFPSADGFPDDETQLEVLAKGARVAALRLRGEDDAEARIQEILQEDTSRLQWSPARRLANGWLTGLYHRAKIGDLVVLPGPGWRKGDGDVWEYRKSLVGEIVGPAERWRERGPQNYLSANLLVRRVNWLAEVDEADLPQEVMVTMRTQNTLVRLQAGNLERVLGAAYRNVLVDGEWLARFTTRNHDFKAHESFHFQAFVMAVVAAYERAENGGPCFEESIYEIASQVNRGLASVPEQDSSIHSPGYTTLKAFAKVPMIVAALYALASPGLAEPFDADGNPSVGVINSESDVLDPCNPDIGLDDDVRRTLEVIGHIRWQEMCRSRLAASEHEGFESIATATSDGN
jgi:hypothetical protein